MTDALPESIRCMLVPLRGRLLLIPNTTVVEIIQFPETTPAEHVPDYWVGYANWHSQQLPVIDLDALLDQHVANTEAVTHLCILKGIHDSVELSLYSLPCYAPPQLISVDADTLHNIEESSHDWLYGQFQIGSKLALIPNLDALESTIQGRKL